MTVAFAVRFSLCSLIRVGGREGMRWEGRVHIEGSLANARVCTPFHNYYDNAAPIAHYYHGNNDSRVCECLLPKATRETSHSARVRRVLIIMAVVHHHGCPSTPP